MNLVDLLLDYVVVPVAAFVWLMYMRQQDHHTEIAVLKSTRELDTKSNERELSEIRATTNKIFVKLDSIEESLRK